MFYYKVPITEGQTDCSAGSILCCAYPQGKYMVCKFESVANVGPNWVEITEEEFEANCPDFPAELPGDNGLPAVTTADNGKFLQVVNGAWEAAELPIYDGTVTVE